MIQKKRRIRTGHFPLITQCLSCFSISFQQYIRLDYLTSQIYKFIVLHFYSSSSFQNIFKELHQFIDANPLKAPFASEQFIVPNNDMGRWLQIHLADELGVAANLKFEMPASFMRRLYEKMDQDYSLYLADKNDFHWIINHLLQKSAQNKNLDVITSYITAEGDEKSDFRRWQIAGQIADIFDQYQMYRAHWLEAWEADRQHPDIKNEPHAAWQKHIWNEICATFPKLKGRAKIQKELLTAIRRGEMDSYLPERILLFAVPTMAPVLVETLMEVAKKTDLHWFEIRVQETNGDEINHPFLSTMTSEQNKFQKIVEKCLNQTEVPAKVHKLSNATSDKKTFLAQIQSDILWNKSPKESELPKPDGSLSIHSCHGPLREVEVLYDQILDYLNNHPEKGPGDIVVTVPDIMTYAPYIEAVFGSPEHEELEIPYDLNDPETGLAAEITNTFLEALQLSNSKFKVTDVVSLLDNPAVRDQYNLDARDIELIEKWIRQTNIRWGWDEHQHEGEYIHSWKFGLDRLMAGIAFEPEFDTPVNGILPYTDIEGSSMLQTLGSFRNFLQVLNNFRDFSSKKQTLADWSKASMHLLNKMIRDDNTNSNVLTNIREQIQKYEEISDRWGINESISYDEFFDWINAALTNIRIGLSYRSGRLIFTSMVPVRTMPFDFVAILGLNEQTIPARDMFSGFDLMGKIKENGDRSRREQDRAMFLESILAAQSVLHLSYTGRQIVDNSETPPSLLITELLEVLENYPTSEDKKVHEDIIFDHSLQGFSEKYMDQKNDRFFTYSAVKKEMASSIKIEKQEPFYAIDQELKKKDSDEADIRIPIEMLYQFYQKPIKSLLNFSAGIKLPYDSSDQLITEYRDVWTPHGLDKWQIKNQLLEACRKDIPAEEIFNYYAAQGALPRSEISKYAFDEIENEVKNFISEVKNKGYWKDPLPEEKFEIELDVNGEIRIITGTFKNLTDDGQQFLYMSKNKSKYDFRGWLYHLAHIIEHIYKCETRVLNSDKGKLQITSFSDIEYPKEILAQIVADFEIGLKEPYFVYPQSAQKYSESFNKTEDRIAALRGARSVYLEAYKSKSDADDDPSLPYIIRQKDPLNEKEFAEKVERTWLEMYKHIEENK